MVLKKIVAPVEAPVEAPGGDSNGVRSLSGGSNGAPRRRVLYGSEFEMRFVGVVVVDLNGDGAIRSYEAYERSRYRCWLRVW